MSSSFQDPRKEELRHLPSVDDLQQSLLDAVELPEPLLVQLIRDVVQSLRESIQKGARCPDREQIMSRVRHRADELAADRSLPVINATGVLLHTNLGRAPYAEAAREAVGAATRSYVSLETNRSTGKRGGRGRYAREILRNLTGAEAAALVNNCSAGLLLILRTLAEGREVLISRGEMVQIGGGFRIPEILRESGAKLREVGTTNSTSLDDYRRAMGPDTAMILSVHQSNFDLEGYGATVPPGQLRSLAKQWEVPLVVDLGSGALVDTKRWGLRHEPQPEEMINQGADLVCFSGDKLMGGPQVGMVVGEEELIKSIRDEPLYRALRCDKSTTVALEQTLQLYLEGRLEELPHVQLFDQTIQQLMERARNIKDELPFSDSELTIEPSRARTGGGTLPDEMLESRSLALNLGQPESTARSLRTAEPSVFGRIEDGTVRLDLRTVFPDEDDQLIEVLQSEL